MKKKIWWLDDEPQYLLSYIEDLQEDGHFDLRFIRDVDEALMLLRIENVSPPDLLIWDMIMPPGEFAGDDAVNDGLRTGKLFFYAFRKRFPLVPVMLFTNVNRSHIQAEFDTPSERSWMFEKRELLPSELMEKVKKLLNESSLEGGA